MMKKIFIILLTFVFAIGLANSVLVAEEHHGNRDKKRLDKSTVVNAYAEFDVNRIRSYIINNGLFANDPPTGYSGLFYPKGTGKTAIYTAGMWLLGLSHDTHKLRACAANYSTDMVGGMILPNGAPDDPTKAEYIVYKYEKGDVVDQAAIDQGCPEEVVGDQMLFCVYNDAAPVPHNAVWCTEPIGVEVRQTVWGYAQAGPLGDCMFMKFQFINKGDVDLDSAYVAIFFDPDLGEAGDDYVACDVPASLGYVYNGAAYDAVYGYQVPALGCDFFQGPMVPSPGDTASLPSGTYPDMKILPMTAFFKYINASDIYVDPSLQTAIGGTMAYNYVRGLIWDGSRFVDPTTGQSSKFVNSGDPVKGTGWLGSAEAPPGDMRMGQSSGPFCLGVGDTMEVVAGIVVGLGTNYLNSVSIMKYNDKVAQFAYDNNWVVGSPPPQPEVEVFEGDKVIALSWDDTAKDLVDDAGYAFEGYNIYQSPSVAGDAAGKWTRIATFDKVNYITKIWDEAYDPEGDALVVKPVQFGTDAGLQYSITIETDKIMGNTPLVNGKNYYFAVTGYTFNAEGTPKSLENMIVPITCVPHKPELKTTWGAGTEQNIPVTASPGDIAGTVTVVDPAKVTGDDYRIDFIFATSGPDSGFANTWKLTDVTKNSVILDGMTNMSGDRDYPIVDGLFPQVIGPEPGAWGLNMNMGRGGWDYSGSRYITGVNWAGAAMYGGLDIGLNFFGSTLVAADYVNVRIDFWNEASNTADPVAHPWTEAYVYHRDQGYAYQGIGTFPGAAYDVDDPANPRRINLCFVEDARAGQGIGDMFWDPVAPVIAGCPDGGREYLFIMNSDYADGAALYDDTNDGTCSDVLYAIWPDRRGSHTSDEEFKMYIYCWHPINEGDNMTFSTEGLASSTSNETAKARIDEIGVFPNPYFAMNMAETRTFDQFVTFINLPEDKCTIRIFSLSGALIQTIEHTNGTSREIWNLLNTDNIPVASGMYIAYIEIPNVGEKILKLAVINREARFLHTPY